MKTNYSLFLGAIGVTFSFIAMLQFVEVPWFFLVLLGMHGGVVLFILSKKRFKAMGYDVARFYSLEYKLLALYLPVLALKVLSALHVLAFNEILKTVLILAITVFSLTVSVINAVKLHRFLKSK